MYVSVTRDEAGQIQTLCRLAYEPGAVNKNKGK